MKKIYFLLLIAQSVLVTSFSQTNQWTWMSGDNTVNEPGVYGPKGVAGTSYKPGGRENAVSWTDAGGNLWLFGGFGYAGNGTPSGSLNDLWKFNPSTAEWTWVGGDNGANSPGAYGTKGVAGATNKPGGRSGSVSWKDAAGNLWLLGGVGYGGTTGKYGYLNDLWKFDPSTGEWTWMSGDNTVNQPGMYGSKGVAGASNQPGARLKSVSWTDTEGNFWLMGGAGYAGSGNNGYLNDLWKFDPSTRQWTWVGGDNKTNQLSVHGTKGVPATSNQPGARQGAVSWSDAWGNLWLMGGDGFIRGRNSFLNDLWKFDPSTRQWTWVGGDNKTNQLSVHGTKGVPATSNQPGARQGAVSWSDAGGNLWLMGGAGYAGSESMGILNDLWKFDPSTGEWTWVCGDNTTTENGLYGIKGVASTTSKPGGGQGAASWVDGAGNLWLMGGWYTSTSRGSSTFRNDVWSFGIASSAGGIFLSTGKPSASHACAGSVLNIGIESNYGFNEDNVFSILLVEDAVRSGNRPRTVRVGSVKSTTAVPIPITLPANTPEGTYKLQVISSSPVVAGISAGLVVRPLPTATITVSSTKTLTASEGDAYLWSTGEATRSIVATQPGDYSVTVTKEGCLVTASTTTLSQAAGSSQHRQTAPAVSASILPAGGLSLQASPNPSATQFSLRVQGLRRGIPATLTISNAVGRVVEKKTISADGQYTLGEHYHTGVYYLQITQGKESITTKVIKTAN